MRPFYHADRQSLGQVHIDPNVLIMQISGEESPRFNDVHPLAIRWKRISADRRCFVISVVGRTLIGPLSYSADMTLGLLDQLPDLLPLRDWPFTN